MQTYRRIPRRATLSLIDRLMIVIFLTVCIVMRKPVPTQKVIPYIKASGHILVQLAKLPERTGAETHNVPLWTLYGDGMLIFRTDPSDTLRQVQLSPSEIQHILDVIINRDAFFEHPAQQYRSIASDKNDDKLLLAVNVDGQQKKVLQMSKPTHQTASDIQTTHVFAIEQFLLDYHPLHSVFYAPNPDPNHESDDQ
ncbi:MAG: hypothetical protein NVS4B11_23710 [Ktedonobacteraceae bacterium]